jgi:hypothetical protein
MKTRIVAAQSALPSVEKLRSFLEADRERFESIMSSPAARKPSPRKPDH